MAALTITTTNMIPVAADATNTFEEGLTNAAITAGQAVYYDPSTGLYGLFDADSGTAAIHTPRGISVSSAPATGSGIVVQTAGTLGFGAILTKGLMYVGGGTTPGSINPSSDLASGWYIHSLGYAQTTSTLFVKVTTSGVAF